VTKLRDALLALGGVLYVLGYASWALYAWRRSIGLLPALEAVILIAGLYHGTKSMLDRLTGLFTYWSLAGALPAVIVTAFLVYTATARSTPTPLSASAR